MKFKLKSAYGRYTIVKNTDKGMQIFGTYKIRKRGTTIPRGAFRPLTTFARIAIANKEDFCNV